MNGYGVFAFLFLNVFFFSCVEKNKDIAINNTVRAEGKLIFEENFESNLNHWKVEQMAEGTVEINDGKLEINDVAGCTTWLNKELQGPIMIEYDAFLIDKGGNNDRVSDLNCFWMAKDPKSESDLFKHSNERGGKFSNYDSLRLYYMGVGGHYNTRTRFRRYLGNGERPLLPEYDFTDKQFLLKPNHLYKIKIVAYDNIIQYYRNDTLMVDYFDPNPYKSGFFGFRTVNNHMTVDNFKVYQLTSKMTN